MEAVPSCSWGSSLPARASQGSECRAGAFCLCRGKAEPPTHAQAQSMLRTLELSGWKQQLCGVGMPDTHMQKKKKRKKQPKESDTHCSPGLECLFRGPGLSCFDPLQPPPPLPHCSFGGVHGQPSASLQRLPWPLGCLWPLLAHIKVK